MRKKPYKREIYRGKARRERINANEYRPYPLLILDYSKALEGWETREKNEEEDIKEKQPVLKKARSFFSKILGKED
jgi:hypothetical protein